MLHSTSIDPFKLALYKLMGKLDPSKRNVPLVTATTEDWLWFQLAMVCFSSSSSFLPTPFYSTLFERNTFLDYRALARQLEALSDLARYLIILAAMVPTAPQARLCFVVIRTPSVGITGYDGGDQ